MSNLEKSDNLAALGSTLCLSCGICCQGIFFYHDNDPKTYKIEIEKITIKNDIHRFPLTCPLYWDECLIYNNPERPRCCSESQCQLLKRLLCDEIDLEESRRVIDKIKVLLYSIKNQMPSVDNSKTFVKQILNYWDLQQKEYSTVKRQNASPLIDIASLKFLLHRYVLPFEGV